jgi:TolA-binding protein
MIKAIDEFQAAMTESPEDNTVTMRARFEIADAQRLKGNLEEAYKTYMLVAILYDNEQYTSEALFQAGEIFTKLGKNDEAKKAYQEVVNSTRKPSAEKAKEKLQVTNETRIKILLFWRF